MIGNLHHITIRLALSGLLVALFIPAGGRLRMPSPRPAAAIGTTVKVRAISLAELLAEKQRPEAGTLVDVNWGVPDIGPNQRNPRFRFYRGSGDRFPVSSISWSGLTGLWQNSGCTSAMVAGLTHFGKGQAIFCDGRFNFNTMEKVEAVMVNGEIWQGRWRITHYDEVLDRVALTLFRPDEGSRP